MKTLVSIILLVVVNPLFSTSDSKYERAMKDALEEMEQAASINDFQDVTNQFERIADVEKERWQPAYHAAYTKVMMAAMEQDLLKKDPYLDAAQKHLDAIEQMEHDGTERMALQGFLTMIRMSVDPSRGMDLGQECAMILNQAYVMNKQNPRAVLMLAQFNHGSAQYLGEDTSESCAMFDEVIQLLDQPEAEESDQFLPKWGKDIAYMMQQQCQE
ncbi:hypothetical protein ACFLU5_14470 [Bacteroidota bacterium]